MNGFQRGCLNLSVIVFIVGLVVMLAGGFKNDGVSAIGLIMAVVGFISMIGGGIGVLVSKQERKDFELKERAAAAKAVRMRKYIQEEEERQR